MEKRFEIFIFFIFFILSSLVIAQLPNQAENRIDFTYPIITFDNNTAYVNSSDFWDNLNTPNDFKFLTNWLYYNSGFGFNGTKLNNTLDDRLEVTYYNASTILTVTGTSQGIIENIRNYNGLSYNVSEDASDLDLRVNFTGITDFNNLIIRYKAEEDEEAHTLHVQLWDYNIGEWEHKGDLPSEIEWNTPHFPIYDSDVHIQNGIVQVRFYQDGGVPPRTHKHEFDWVTISLGLGTPAPEEVDPSFNSWLNNPIFINNVTAINFFGNTTGKKGNFTTIYTNQISPQSGNIVKIGTISTTLQVQAIDNIAGTAITFHEDIHLNNNNVTNFNIMKDFGRILFPNGTIAFPSFSFKDGLKTGFSLGNDKHLDISVGGIKKASFNSNGLLLNTIKNFDESNTYGFSNGFSVTGDYDGTKPLSVVNSVTGTLFEISSKGWTIFNNFATGDQDAFTIDNVGLGGDNVLMVKGNGVDFFWVNNSGSAYVKGRMDADYYVEHSVVSDYPEDKNALDYFTTTWEDRSYLNEKEELIYNHTNRDDKDLLLIIEDIVECDYETYINSKGKESERKVNCSIVGQTEKKSVSGLVELQRDAIYELKEDVDNLKSSLCLSDPFECVLQMGIEYIVRRINS